MKQFENNKFEEIYVLHTAFLGDIFISFYFLDKLKRLNPDSKINFITTPIMAEPSQTIKSIDNVIIFDKRNLHKKLIDAKNFGKNFNRNSLFISLHRSLRSSVMAFYANSNEKVLWNNASIAYLFKNKIKYKYHFHERHRLYEFLKIFKNHQISQEKPNVEINIDVNKDNFNCILIFPGSVWATKRWLEEYFIEVATKLKSQGYDVMVCGSNAEYDICENIAKKSKSANLAGKFSLVEMMKIVSKSKLIICNDSAPTHIANLFHTPVITIFGPTAPFFGFAPIEGKVIYSNEKCSPCNIHGPRQCPIGTHQCMKNVTPRIVLKGAEEYLSRL